MSFQLLTKDRQLKIALDLCKKQAEQGKDSFFDQWWYFDTNCLSELVKLFAGSHSTAVHDFVAGRNILLTSTSMQELRKVPNILQLLPSALKTANLYMAPDNTKFWYTDISNFLNVDRIPMNSLEAYPLQPDLLKMITSTHSAEFEQICSASEREVAQQFFTRVGPDIGADLDERDLSMHIWKVVNKFGHEWFKVNIPPADCNAANFPSLYVFFYTYYFRYVRSGNVKPDLNDFIDLANCSAAPYCERYYCEATFAHLLRNYVKGRKPPTAFELIKKAYKKGLITEEVYRAQKQAKGKLSHTAALLEHTEIFNFAQMRSQIV
jgi:hypothetical protein